MVASIEHRRQRNSTPWLVAAVSKPWYGHEKLYRVFWFHTLVPTLAAVHYTDVAYFWSPLPRFLTYAVTLVWLIWISRSLWLCAFNARLLLWGLLVRAGLLLLAVVALAELFFGIFR